MESQENLKGEEITALLEIARATNPSQVNGFVDSLSALAEHPIFKGYNLEPVDLQIIAILFESALEGNRVNTREILKALQISKPQYLSEIKRLIKLWQKGAIEIEGDPDLSHPQVYFQLSWRIQDELFSRIYPLDEDQEEEVMPYLCNREYIEDQLEWIRSLKEVRFPALRWRSRIHSDPERGLELRRLERVIARRLALTNILFPLEAFKKEHDLAREEGIIILYLLRAEIDKEDFVTVDELIEIVKGSCPTRLKPRLLFQKEAKLVREHLIRIKEQTPVSGGSTAEVVTLNERLRGELLGEKRRRKRKTNEVLDKNSLFDLITPRVSFDQVILPEKTANQITEILEINYGVASKLLRSWGIISNHQVRSTNPPLTMIFFGPPGTGKTLTAYAIASRLGRSVLTLDCSRIIDRWVGDSEKNVKKIFAEYSEISRKMKHSPILLLNEADQFLSCRITASHSVDLMNNKMQSIFLEEMERFSGILIATTNLIENIDSAFSRRFQVKVEFRRPAAEERIRLWKALIPANAPLSSNVDLKHLAEQYDLSGGQLSVVIRNAAVKAAKRGSSLSQEDFVLACEQEIAGNFDNRADRHVGFLI